VCQDRRNVGPPNEALVLPAWSPNLNVLPSGLWGPLSPSAWSGSCHSAKGTSGLPYKRLSSIITRSGRTRSGQRAHCAQDHVDRHGQVMCRARLDGVLKFYYRGPRSPMGRVFARVAGLNAQKAKGYGFLGG